MNVRQRLKALAKRLKDFLASKKRWRVHRSRNVSCDLAVLPPQTVRPERKKVKRVTEGNFFEQIPAPSSFSPALAGARCPVAHAHTSTELQHERRAASGETSITPFDSAFDIRHSTFHHFPSLASPSIAVDSARKRSGSVGNISDWMDVLTAATNFHKHRRTISRNANETDPAESPHNPHSTRPLARQ